MDFLRALNSYMQANHLTKSTLSKLTGIPYTTIDGWYKKGSNNIKLSSVKKLSDALGVEMSYWLGNNQNESPKPEGMEDSQDIESIACALENMLIQLGFIQSGEDITDADYRFLRSVVALIQAYFDDGS